jgi:hypothetical protein
LVIGRRGIALPAVLLALVALGVLSSLALIDAMLAHRASRLAEDQVRARAAALSALPQTFTPADLGWLCLQPPAAPARQTLARSDGATVELAWWVLGRGVVRAEVRARGPAGSRHRLLVSLRVDSLPTDSTVIGCPGATRLVPRGGGWWRPLPEG